MKESKQCPKCGSSDIAVRFSESRWIPNHKDDRHKYLCLACGYLETYYCTPKVHFDEYGEGTGWKLLNPKPSAGPFR